MQYGTVVFSDKEAQMLWGTGARAPLDLQQLIFSVHFDLCKV